MKTRRSQTKPANFLIGYVFLLVAFLCGGAAAEATTYYVSQASGSDSWDGLAPSHGNAHGPWKTLAKASQTYAPGDRLLLKCGDTWENDALCPKGSGTPEKPITIASYGAGKKPLLDGLDDQQDRMGIHLVDVEGYKITGIEFTRCMTGIYAECADGSPLRKYLWIEDCDFHDSQLYGHYEDYPKRKIGLGICIFSYECRNRIVLSDITIKNCTFRRLASGIWSNSPDNFNQKAGNIWNFGNLVIEGCRFEDCKQWPLGLRGIAGGVVRNCVTLDIGRHNVAWNGVAGSMIQRCKDFVYEDSEWGFISLGPPGGLASCDGQAFDFEVNNINHVMRRCVFHDTDGPCFMFCNGASGPEPEVDILLENCVFNGKSARSMESGHPKVEITNCSKDNRAEFRDCRIYLSEGERLTQTPAGLTFTNCLVKKLSKACSTPNLATTAKASASSGLPGNEAVMGIDGKAGTSWKAAASADQWLQLDFAQPTTVNEFRIKENASSSISRYAIECWDDKTSVWVSCFNGLAIGPDFIAPVVSRTTTKARLLIKNTRNGNPGIAEFAVHNDTTSGPPDPPPSGPPPTGVVNDSHDHVIYSGQWEPYTSAAEIEGDEHYSNEKGAACQFTFSGTGITWIGVKNFDNGEAEVHIDGTPEATVDTYNAARLSRQELFKKTGLSKGKHTIRIAVKGTKNAASKDSYVVVDAFKVEE